MMLGFGLLAMLIVIGLPILLIGGIVAVTLRLLGRRPGQTFSPSAQVVSAPGAPSARYCSHCGSGLQAAWTHCPSCGAGIET